MSAPPPVHSLLPARTRVPSAKIIDKNNAEARNAQRQRGVALKHLVAIVKEITHLVPRLPDSVPEPNIDDNKILRVLTSTPADDDTVASVFNRRFDILFGEDCRDEGGRMKYIRRGKEGMDLVVAYLASIQWDSEDNLLGIAPIKLQQMVAELRHLCSTNATGNTANGKEKSAQKSTQPATTSSKTVPTKTSAGDDDDAGRDRDYQPR
ncbi:unnamed protein product [Mycena citricolor]|uniref:Uncharacterized protein n=1 Tax=Mycena citricolor TaxID=2018698 RepID=A0AAD2HHT6_9AGAR|nr:unnamed protein product [Mycena citricolor]